MLDVILKRFDAPDETRVFEKGKFEIVHIGGMMIGRASYEPGWKWSEHVSPVAGTEFCESRTRRTGPFRTCDSGDEGRKGSGTYTRHFVLRTTRSA